MDLRRIVEEVEERRRQDYAMAPPAAPRANFRGEGTAASIAREAVRAEHAAHAPARGTPRAKGAREDFLARYLVMSEEFERRYKAKGWTNLVRKKCSSELRP
jgi:hypothetical protein